VLEKGHGKHAPELGLEIIKIMDDKPGRHGDAFIKSSYSPTEKIKSAAAIRKVSMIMMSWTVPRGSPTCVAAKWRMTATALTSPQMNAAREGDEREMNRGENKIFACCKYGLQHEILLIPTSRN
jgi:hypothetical protein